MFNEANKAVVNRFIGEILNQQNLAALDEICSSDYVELDPMPGQAPGLEGLKQFFSTQYFPAFPDKHWTVKDRVAEGDYGISRCTWRGTHLGNFLGIPATGKKVSVSIWSNDHIVICRLEKAVNEHHLPSLLGC